MEKSTDRARAEDRTETHAQHRPTRSDQRIHDEQLHEEAERDAVEVDDFNEVLESTVDRERPREEQPPPAGWSWPVAGPGSRRRRRAAERRHDG